MVEKLRIILTKWSSSIVELTVFFPLVLLAAIYLVPPHLFYSWIASLPVFYLLGICTRLIIRKRFSHLIVDLVISGGLALSSYGWNFNGAFCFIIAFCLFYRGILLVEVPWKELFPLGLYWFGTLTYFLCSFLARIADGVKPFASLIAGLGLLCLILTLYVTNYFNLQSAAMSGPRKPVLSRSLLWQNRFYVVILFLLTFGMSNLSQIKDWLAWLSHLLFYAFISVFNALFLIPLPQAQPSHPLVNHPSSSPHQTGGHLNPLPLKLVYVLLGIAAILLLRFLLPKFILFVKRAIQWLLGFFTGMLSHFIRLDHPTGFEDESERLLPKAFWKLRTLDRWKDWLMMKLRSEPRFSDLTTNRQRARYLYRQLVLRAMLGGYPYKEFLTPQETGEDLRSWGMQPDEPTQPLIDLYNVARYSEHLITDEQLEPLILNRHPQL